MFTPILSEQPCYIAGAFNSQARALNVKDRKVRQNACFIASIARFTKKQGATCFASPETILQIFNENSAKYGLKPISRSTLFIIQKRCFDGRLLSYDRDYSQIKCRHFRKIILNIAQITMVFPHVMKLAAKRAHGFLMRKLDSHRNKAKSHKKINKIKNLDVSDSNDNRTITTKRSKDLKYKNKVPDANFFKKRFQQDCDLAYQLQNHARSGSISASGAKKLISLHRHHGVQLDSRFYSFLLARIINNNVIKPTKKRNNLEIKRVSTSQSNKVQLPAYELDHGSMQAGIELRHRIQMRIKHGKA